MPRILISNDDGIGSPGIRALAAAMRPLGEVTVVAPDREQSAASHAISLHRPLRLTEVEPGWWQVDGTPTDAVYLGIHHLMKGSPPDLVVSGINLGANLGNDVTYSGTVAAAFEGCLFGIPSVAFSLVARAPKHFDAAVRFARALATRVLDVGLPEGVLLNVNLPKGEPHGWKVTRLGRRSYGEQVEERLDPWGRSYYWIGGTETAHADIPGSDCNAVFDEGLVSVTPLHLDLTHAPSVPKIAKWRLDGWEARGGA
ncbi:MAG: 5'/3'-nucleotidase SurE [Deltaproteobacteria bacterium]|nr:MAG: 5'/3'-nucleotidase SurE [Deltaproteobacteria bacterium]